jgi:hypothetical protein
MNQSRALFLTAAFVLAFSAVSFADNVQGTIRSINHSSSTVTIADPVTGSSRTVKVHPKVLDGVDEGSIVKATLRSGTDEVDTLEVVVAQ